MRSAPQAPFRLRQRAGKLRAGRQQLTGPCAPRGTSWAAAGSLRSVPGRCRRAQRSRQTAAALPPAASWWRPGRQRKGGQPGLRSLSPSQAGRQALQPGRAWITQADSPSTGAHRNGGSRRASLPGRQPAVVREPRTYVQHSQARLGASGRAHATLLALSVPLPQSVQRGKAPRSGGSDFQPAGGHLQHPVEAAARHPAVRGMVRAGFFCSWRRQGPLGNGACKLAARRVQQQGATREPAWHVP